MKASPSPRSYLLAAGRGRRAGGPKAWRVHEGKPLLERQLDFLLTRFRPEALAVSIQKPWLDRCRSLHPRVAWVPVDADAAPLGALLALLDNRRPSGWGFVHHVDMPVWEPELFDLLARQIPGAERSGAEAVVPSHRGRRGHPVLLSPRAWPSLRALNPAKDRLDVWLRGRPLSVVDTPYACVLENWNRPEA